MNDPQKYLLEHLRKVEANQLQLQQNAMMNDDATTSRGLVTSSLLAMQSRQLFPDAGNSSLATTERFLLLQRLIEKHSMNQSSCPPLTSIGGLKVGATANNTQTPSYNPMPPNTGAFDPRHLHFHEIHGIHSQQAGRGLQLSNARQNISNASIVSKLASNVSEKTSFPLPKVKAAPVKKLQLISFRKAWSQLDHCPNNYVRKEIFSRRLYQNRHEVHGSTRSVIRQNMQKESPQI